MTEEVDDPGYAFMKFSQCIRGVVGLSEMALVVQKKSESPIETAVAMRLPRLLDGTRYEMQQQYVWRRRRVDIAIVDRNTGAPAMFIECDGAEFHSSDDAIERDKRKDIEATENGIITMRFSGSQICRNPEACAESILFRLGRGVG